MSGNKDTIEEVTDHDIEQNTQEADEIYSRGLMTKQEYESKVAENYGPIKMTIDEAKELSDRAIERGDTMHASMIWKLYLVPNLRRIGR